MGRTAAREISTADTGRQTAVVAAKKKGTNTGGFSLWGKDFSAERLWLKKKKFHFSLVTEWKQEIKTPKLGGILLLFLLLCQVIESFLVLFQLQIMMYCSLMKYLWLRER